MTDENTADGTHGDFERLPDGQIRVTGKLLAQLQQNAAERHATEKVHQITMEVAMEVAERRIQELALKSTEWWKEVAAVTGLPKDVSHRADPSTGIIEVVPGDDAEQDPGEHIAQAITKALRENGFQAVFGSFDMSGDDEDDKAGPAGVQ